MSRASEVPQAVMQALQRGDKMEAIKQLREATGGDLKSAMEMIQKIAAQVEQAKRSGSHSGQHFQPETEGQRENRERTDTILAGHRTPTVMPGDAGGRGLFIWVLIALALTGAWFWFKP
ncbi:MAG TPA: hypothetical protein VGE64_02975 [Xanthomonadaceae bacterium]|jgi:hypothetical protein